MLTQTEPTMKGSTKMVIGRFTRALNQSALWDDPQGSNRNIPFYRGVAPGQDPLKPSPLEALFITPSREEAMVFTGNGRGHVVELRLLTDNIFDGGEAGHLQKAGFAPEEMNELRLWDSAYVENPATMTQIREAGFDGFYVRDRPIHPKGFWNVGVFDPSMVELVGGQS